MSDEPVGERLAAIEAILYRIEASDKSSFDNLFSAVRDIRKDFAAHLLATATDGRRLMDIENNLSKQNSDLYSKEGLIPRVERLEHDMNGIKKVGWEVTKPMLYVIGVAFILILGSLGFFIYQLSEFLTVLQKLP
jgi:hypothetical protein